jgi:hypothetical protein
MSRTCCHHYPGGIVRCVSRSLPSRRRPSPLVWRVGSHNDGFGACSVFTRVTARAVRWPPEEAVSQSASGHSSPPDPPRVLPAGARVRRPGFSPGRTVHLGKAHTPTSSREACVPLCSIGRTRSSPATIKGRRTGHASLRSSKPANCEFFAFNPQSTICVTTREHLNYARLQRAARQTSLSAMRRPVWT